MFEGAKCFDTQKEADDEILKIMTGYSVEPI